MFVLVRQRVSIGFSISPVYMSDFLLRGGDFGVVFIVFFCSTHWKKGRFFSKIALEKFRVGGYQDIDKPDAVFIYLCNRSVPFGFATRYLSKQNCKIALISCASNLS